MLERVVLLHNMVERKVELDLHAAVVGEHGRKVARNHLIWP